jgi:hypothetical protein
MLVYLVLHLCLISDANTCDDRTLPVSSMECAIHGQSLAINWMAENNYPTARWRLDNWRCQRNPPRPEKDADRYRPQAG